MTPQQEAAERDIIFATIMMLRDLRDAGHNDWQTLTSFLANLLMDQDNSPKMLKRLVADVKLNDAPDAGDSITTSEAATIS